MPQENRVYIAIDLKSFYASVECVDRGLDPLTTNLVVADQSRTEKTICLAVSPSLKSYGISGRARLFEVVQRMKEVNAERKLQAPGHIFTGSSYDDRELKCSPELSAEYITATPRMARYMEYSTKIYKIYLNYIAPEDIHVYSVDEVFMDATGYLSLYHVSIRQLAEMIIREVLRETGITATVGIGKNLYLCKIAMDIMAKRVAPDQDGVRIAELDEMEYRQLLWNHRPITDFWRVGNGYARKLEERGLFTMGDVARCSVGKATDFYNEDLLYKMFGVNAELLIDHAWGWEPCTMADIKAYKPNSSSLGSGQVLQYPYSYEKGKLIVCEMTDLLSLDLVEKGLVTDQLVLNIGYDKESLSDPERKKRYKGLITLDHYGRRVPKHAHGTINLKQYTSSTEMLLEAVTKLYERVVDRELLIHRVTITANHVIKEKDTAKNMIYEQMDLFTDYTELQRQQEKENIRLEREKKIQNTMIYIRKKYGKNAILRGMNLEEGAMTVERNRQIGGHKA